MSSGVWEHQSNVTRFKITKSHRTCILVTGTLYIRIINFSLSFKVTTNICEETAQQFKDVQVFGTPDYIAPEVILRKGYGKPFLIKLFGVTLTTNSSINLNIWNFASSDFKALIIRSPVQFLFVVYTMWVTDVGIDFRELGSTLIVDQTMDVGKSTSYHSLDDGFFLNIL